MSRDVGGRAKQSVELDALAQQVRALEAAATSTEARDHYRRVVAEYELRAEHARADEDQADRW